MRNAVLGNVSGPGRTPDGSAPPRSAEGGAPPDGGPRSADSAEQPVWEYRDLILPLEIPLSTETPRGYELTKRRYEQIVVPQLEEARKDGWETLEPADFEATIRANRLDHSRLPDDPLDDPAVIHSVMVRLGRLVRGAVPRDRDSGRWERRVISVPLGVEFRGREEDLPAWYRECEGLILRELQAAGKDGWAPEHRIDLSSLVDNDRAAGDFPLLVSATISLKRPLAAGDASGPSAAPDQATSDAQRTLSSSTDRVRQLLTEAEQAGWERPQAVEELLSRAFAGDPLVEAHSTELANLATRLLAAQGRRYRRLLDLSLGLEAARTEEDEDETDSGPHGSLIVGLLALVYGERRSGTVPVWFASALERSLGTRDALRLFFGRLEPEQTSDMLLMGYRLMRPSSAIDFAQYTAGIPESIPHVVALML
jgi:hypothetical protein